MKLYYPDGMRAHGETACQHLNFEKYNPQEDQKEPALFWLYFQEDYEYLLGHEDKKFVFWHGSDVLRLRNFMELRYYLRDIHAEEIQHACHSKLLQDELAELGIYAQIRPVFWNNIDKYKHSYEYSNKPELYICSKEKREIEYGEGYVVSLSKIFPDCRFHVYGAEGYSTENLIYHGTVSEKTIDAETKDMQICLRLNKHDGFSQTVMKAILMGQFVITSILYKGIPLAKNFKALYHVIESYIKVGDSYYIDSIRKWEKEFNNFDWLKI